MYLCSYVYTVYVYIYSHCLHMWRLQTVKSDCSSPRGRLKRQISQLQSHKLSPTLNRARVPPSCADCLTSSQGNCVWPPGIKKASCPNCLLNTGSVVLEKRGDAFLFPSRQQQQQHLHTLCHETLFSCLTIVYWHEINITTKIERLKGRRVKFWGSHWHEIK